MHVNIYYGICILSYIFAESDITLFIFNQSFLAKNFS